MTCGGTCPGFCNPDNFAGNPDNVFGGIRLANLICHPKERAEKVPHLRRVSGPDDWWENKPDNRPQPALIRKAGGPAVSRRYQTGPGGLAAGKNSLAAGAGLPSSGQTGRSGSPVSRRTDAGARTL